MGSDDKGKGGRLALTRRIGEEVVVGDPDQPLGSIRVVDIQGDKVKLSFDFPRNVQINRKELAEQKRTQRPGQGASPPPTGPRGGSGATSG